MEHSATSTLVRPNSEEIGPDFRPIDPGTRNGVTPLVDHRTRPTLRRRLVHEGTLVFLFSLAAYLVVAVLLDFTYHSFLGDAFSRMANGSYILYSRDPHLAAVGFVWDPLPSLIDMVFLLGNHLWPALSHNLMAGSLTSAIAMAAAVYQLNAACREWGVERLPRLALTALFALDPLILLYSGNGMSEGIYLFTLMAATRYLLRWIRAKDLRSLAYAGIALGFSYLARNEAAGAIVAGALTVALVSYWDGVGERAARVRTGLADATIFAVPGVIAAVGWAVASFVITGSAFGQYSSLYGSSEQESLVSHETFHNRLLYEFHAVFAMWPLVPVVLVLAIVVALRKKDPAILAPLTVLGGALGFDGLALLNNNIQPYFRYFIVTIPIEAFLVASLLARVPSSDRGRLRLKPPAGRHATRTLLRNAGAVLLVFAVMIPAGITTAGAMFNLHLGPEELDQLGFIMKARPTQFEIEYGQRYPDVIRIGNYLANLHLPNGDVIVDNSLNCVPEIIATISQPKLFVIPNNRDFQRTLADPVSFHAQYILEAQPKNYPIDAPNIQYPNLWSSGAGFAKEVHQVPSRGTCPEFRLFKVFAHTTHVA
jgi:hypothetical protein